MIPCQSVIPEYESKKAAYLKQIQESKQASTNSMHKYTSVMPLNRE